MLGCNRILYSPIGSVISLFPIMRDRSHFEECRGCGFTGDIRTERETRKGQQKSRRGTAGGGGYRNDFRGIGSDGGYDGNPVTIENGNQWRASRVALNESVYSIRFPCISTFYIGMEMRISPSPSPPPRGSLIKNLFGTECNRERVTILLSRISEIIRN